MTVKHSAICAHVSLFYCEASYMDEFPWCEHLFSIDNPSACDGDMVCSSASLGCVLDMCI